MSPSVLLNISSASEDETLCRLCYEPSSPKNPLIVPCECRGSLQFAHKDCILQWIDANNRIQSGEQIGITCTNCKCRIETKGFPKFSAMNKVCLVFWMFSSIPLFLLAYFFHAILTYEGLTAAVMIGLLLLCAPIYVLISDYRHGVEREITHRPPTISISGALPNNYAQLQEYA